MSNVHEQSRQCIYVDIQYLTFKRGLLWCQLAIPGASEHKTIARLAIWEVNLLNSSEAQRLRL